MIRFGRHAPPKGELVEKPAVPAQQWPAREPWRAPHELFVRHARKDGQLVAVLRAVDRGETCVVEAEVYPGGSSEPVRPGPYAFRDSSQAGAFVTEAVAALMYLGCDVQAQ